jgi:hypothetical protein
MSEFAEAEAVTEFGRGGARNLNWWSERIGAASGRLARPIILIPVVFVILFARHPDLILRPEFVWEEAGEFWVPAVADWPAFFQPWGFLQVGARIAFAIARLGPWEAAPAVAIACHWLVISAVAAFIASERMADAIPDRRIRLLSAVGLPLLGSEAIGTALDMHWYLAILLVALAVARPARWDALIVLVAGLTGPASIVTWPLYWRRPRLAAMVLACGMVQALVYLASGRNPTPLDFPLLIGQLAPLCVLWMLSAYRSGLPRRTAASFGWTGLALAIGGSLTLGARFLSYPIWLIGLFNGDGSRYLLVATFSMLVTCLSGLIQRRPGAIVVSGLFLALAVTSFVQGVPPDTGWPSQSHCIGGPTPCRLIVFPEDWSVEWTPPVRPSPSPGVNETDQANP